MLGQKMLLSSQLNCFTGAQSSRCTISCRASQNGLNLNGSTHPMGNQQTVEMHIASTDSFDEYDHSNGNGIKRRNSVHVKPPRTESPQQLESYTGSQSIEKAAAERAEIKAVKAEISMLDSELRAKDSELVSSERHLRAREAEVALLRAALTGRDISLRNAKAEAAEAQSQVRDKDNELQHAFQQLLTNSKERASLRQRLLTVQDELSDTRNELENWTKKGFELDQNGRVTNGTDQITKLLEDLSRLSQNIADDAHADEEALNESARTDDYADVDEYAQEEPLNEYAS